MDSSLSLRPSVIGLVRCHRCHILRSVNGIETLPTLLGSPYIRSKRRHSSIQTREQFLIFTTRHAGLTTHKLAVESPFATPKIEILARDKIYDDQSLQNALCLESFRTLLRHQLFAAYDHAHNARLDSEFTTSVGWPRPRLFSH